MTDRDCKHGGAFGWCEMCDLETQRDEAEDAADRIGRTLVDSEQRVADLETALREIREADTSQPPSGDKEYGYFLTELERVVSIARKALGEDDD